MSVLRYFIYTSGHSLFSREKRALLVAGRVAPLFTRRGEPAAAAARLGGARGAGLPGRRAGGGGAALFSRAPAASVALAGDDEGEGAKPRRRRKRRDRPVPEDGEHDEVRAAVASMVATVLADVARLKDVQKLREVEALRVESLRARLAAAELEEKIAAERLRELQDRDAAQLIQDL